MPRELRQAAKGTTMPIVVVTNSDGSTPITGFTATGNSEKSVKQIARDLKKQIRENPEIIAGGPATDDQEEDYTETEKEVNSNSGYNLLVDSREWTNSDGKIITAAVVSADVSEVTFLMANGKQVKYPLSKLSQESQAALAEIIQ